LTKIQIGIELILQKLSKKLLHYLSQEQMNCLGIVRLRIADNVLLLKIILVVEPVALYVMMESDRYT
jgi:hypothetical protein